MMTKRIPLLFCLLLGLALADSSSARDLSSLKIVGVRFGVWRAENAKHVQAAPGEQILTDVAAPYGEVHISLGLNKGFAAGISIGSCYRGETRYNDQYGYYWKRVYIYPIGGEITYYPLYRSEKSRWQPYLDTGAALVSGTEDIRFGEYSGPLLYSGSGLNTYLTVGWHGGMGMDFSLTRSLIIGLDMKYRGTRFSHKVGGVKDFSGPEATLGLSYVLKGF
jgi:opacity protein-like surface antigen